LFAGTPYEHDALGTRPSFDATDATRLRQFYNTWYAPNNAILVIVGGVGSMATVRTAFDAAKPHPLSASPGVSVHPFAARTAYLPNDFPIGVVA
jgi:zinc protease